MKKIILGLLILGVLLTNEAGIYGPKGSLLLSTTTTQESINTSDDSRRIKDINQSSLTKIKLPKPSYKSSTSIEEALLKRRSIRKYKDEPLSISHVSQLLWAVQGITDHKRGFRTAPSAGALYPLKIRIVIGDVEGIPKGVYKYEPYSHEIIKVKDGDVREELSIAGLYQYAIKDAPVVIVISCIYEITTKKYRERGIRYVHMEVGHAAQNVCLQAISLNLGTVVIGAFYDDEVKKILGMEEEECPLYIIPVGKV